MKFQDHITFYLNNKISPVHQDVTDLQKHFERRGSLYCRLGVPLSFIKGKSFLEVGPGSGHNSLYVANCLPSLLDLLEPNPIGCEEISNLYKELKIPHCSPRIIPLTLENFKDVVEYDFVAAEAWIGSTEHELSLIKKLGTYVKVGGILILTLQSPIGMYANLLRRLLSYELIKNINDFTEKTNILYEAFSSHLSTMLAMSKPHKDWIQDNLLNPAALTSYLIPNSVFNALPSFNVYESYPKFLNEWRWYKELCGEKKSLNNTFLKYWTSQSHNFFDVSTPPIELSVREDINKLLEIECLALINNLIDCETYGVSPDKKFSIKNIERVSELFLEINNEWSQALSEFLEVYKKELITTKDVSIMKKFGKIFGREMIYLSLIREK